jgi:CubicO group peptidase (beta-lactamase class C family)
MSNAACAAARSPPRAAPPVNAVEVTMTPPARSRTRRCVPLRIRGQCSAALLGATLLLSLPLSLHAQETPCTAPGAVVQDVLDRLTAATNVGTFAAIDHTIDSLWDARLPAERRDALRTMLGRWHWESTSLTPLRQCGSDARGYRLLTNAQTGEVDSIQVFVLPASRKVAGFSLVRGARIPLAAADTSNDAARVANLRALTRRMAASGVFSGEVLFARDGRILYHEALGLSNRSTGRPTRSDERYSIASTGKLITATAIMQLVEQHRLSLDDTLGRFLAAGERPAAAAGVPLKTILSHTDGMTNGSDSLAFPPGTRFSYVNYGYFLLGRVIEKVTGKPFADHFATAVFAPAGMTSTIRLAGATADSALPAAYDVRFDSTGIRFVANSQAQTIPATGAGGLFSTASDLFHFAEGLRTGRLVSRSTVAQMRTPRRELGAMDYGYGIDLYRGNNVWGHSGALPGVEAELELYGDSGYVFVLLANTVTGDAIRRRVNALVGLRSFCDTLCSTGSHG